MNAIGNHQCQLALLDDIRVGDAQPVARPLMRRLLLAVSRRIPQRIKRGMRTYYFLAFYGYQSHQPPVRPQTTTAPGPTAPVLKTGDIVRVRTETEIVATLDPWGRLKGCRFMPEMRPYCSTQQIVHKPLEQFFDECEYSIKKSKGLVLLKDVMCQGVADSGRCDRSCFYFWRVEWLEILSGGPDS